MPNHVYSKLIVTGSFEETRRFRKFAKTKDCEIDANRFIPYPETYKKLDRIAREWEKKNTINGGRYKEGVDFRSRPKDGFNSGGYEWCINNWGTKWGFYSFSKVEMNKNNIVYKFETAWSPAIPVIIQASVLFPTLKFRYQYEDEGWNYIGYAEFFNGEKIKEKNVDYKDFVKMFDVKDFPDTEEGEKECEKDRDRIKKEINEWLDNEGLE